MHKIRDGISELVEKMNPISRWTIRIGSIIIALVYICAIAVLLMSGKYIDSGVASNLCDNILYCAKECIGAVYIPAFIIEILDILDGKQRKKKDTDSKNKK